MSVDLQIENQVATITINRPEALNALNADVLDGIAKAVGDASGAGAIILTGAGKAFVAGADIAAMQGMGPEPAAEFSRKGQAAFAALQNFPGPTIAAINGFALGGGLELALACDIILCSEKAKLGLPETTLGLIPGFGGTQRLARRVGPGMAKKLMFTGQMVGASEAQQIGLSEGTHTPDELLADAMAMAAATLRNGPLAIQSCKQLVNVGLDMELDAAIALEADKFGAIFGTKDAQEGMTAFLDKRPAQFRGE